MRLAQTVITWSKYILAVSRSSVENWLLFRSALAIVITALLRRRVWHAPGSVLLGLALVAWRLRRFSRRKVHRRESLTSGDDEGSLDFTYRNPRWAEVNTRAVQPHGGYIPQLSVDGTPEIEILRGAASFSSVGRPHDPLEVWLLPFATYHVDEMGPVLRELQARGVSAGFVFTTNPSEAALARTSIYTDQVHLLSDVEDQVPAIALSMMDWGPIGEVTQQLRRRGTRIVSKIEGAQDFRNLDTPRRILPYSSSDCVLAQGVFDLNNVAARSNVEVVGSTRLEQQMLLAANGLIEPQTQGVLINLNFSYGAYEAWQRPWHALATAGAGQQAGMVTTSVHPAVNAEFVNNRSKWPLALDLETCSHLVTRCSTAMFDALAIGRPVVYFNPHRERVWRGLPWNLEVPQARTRTGLSIALEQTSHGERQLRTEWLLNNFLSVDNEKSAAQRVADVLLAET